MAWHGGGRRRADARQGRQRSPRRILTAELYRFLEAVPIGAGTYLEIRQDSCGFLPCQTKNFSRQSAYRHLLVQLLSVSTIIKQHPLKSNFFSAGVGFFTGVAPTGLLFVSKKWLRHFFEKRDRAEFGPQGISDEVSCYRSSRASRNAESAHGYPVPEAADIQCLLPIPPFLKPSPADPGNFSTSAPLAPGQQAPGGLTAPHSR